MFHSSLRDRRMRQVPYSQDKRMSQIPHEQSMAMLDMCTTVKYKFITDDTLVALQLRWLASSGRNPGVRCHCEFCAYVRSVMCAKMVSYYGLTNRRNA